MGWGGVSPCDSWCGAGSGKGFFYLRGQHLSVCLHLQSFITALLQLPMTPWWAPTEHMRLGAVPLLSVRRPSGHGAGGRGLDALPRPLIRGGGGLQTPLTRAVCTPCYRAPEVRDVPPACEPRVTRVIQSKKPAEPPVLPAHTICTACCYPAHPYGLYCTHVLCCPTPTRSSCHTAPTPRPWTCGAWAACLGSCCSGWPTWASQPRRTCR